MSGMPRAHNGARRKHEWLNKTVWGSGSQARLSQEQYAKLQYACKQLRMLVHLPTSCGPLKACTS
eukprot:scaffold71971_cov18-Tisochrysis_lutea.AAC.1